MSTHHAYTRHEHCRGGGATGGAVNFVIEAKSVALADPSQQLGGAADAPETSTGTGRPGSFTGGPLVRGGSG